MDLLRSEPDILLAQVQGVQVEFEEKRTQLSSTVIKGSTLLIWPELLKSGMKMLLFQAAAKIL